MASIFGELRRRKVFRVAALYAVAAWVLIQVSDVVLPTFGAPSWVNQTIIFLLIVGLIPTLIAAWAYELTPDGVKLESNGTGTVREQPPQSQGLLYATFALVLLVVGFQFAEQFLDANADTTPQPSGSKSLSRLSMSFAEGQELNPARADFTLSPDGNTFIYVGANASGLPVLFLRPLAELRSKPLLTGFAFGRPKVSHNNDEALMRTQGELRIVALNTGTETTFTGIDVGTSDWSPDDKWIYFGDRENGGISRVLSTGGELEAVIRPENSQTNDHYEFVDVLPEENLIYSVRNDDGDSVLQTYSAETGLQKNLATGRYPIYTSSGYLLFQRREGAQLLAAPFDLDTLSFSGPIQEIARGLKLEGSGAGNVGVSNNGRLIYRLGPGESFLATPVWVDRSGNMTELVPDWWVISRNGEGLPTLSPQGDQLALSIFSGVKGSDIWISQLDGLRSRFTFGERYAHLPSWAPDGESIVYVEAEEESTTYRRKNADGSGPGTELFSIDRQTATASFSPDGEWAVFSDIHSLQEGPHRIHVARVSDSTTVRTLIESKAEIGAPAISPDGRWIAYNSNESGEWEIYVQPFPDVGAGRWQVSTNGGKGPLWARNGKELFYVNDSNEMSAVTISEGVFFQWGRERALFAIDGLRSDIGVVSPYDIDAEGQRFLMMRYRGGAESELVVMDNWTALLQ